MNEMTRVHNLITEAMKSKVLVDVLTCSGQKSRCYRQMPADCVVSSKNVLQNWRMCESYVCVESQGEEPDQGHKQR
jgi:hypothetical protein